MTDKEKIENGEQVHCWICKEVFERETLTWRYCNNCEKGFCEDAHGRFRGKKGFCLACDTTFRRLAGCN